MQEEEFYLSRRATRARRKRFSRARLLNRLLLLALVVSLGLLAGGGFWFWQHRESPSAPPPNEMKQSAGLSLRETRAATPLLLPPMSVGARQNIVVHIPSRTLDWYKDGKLVKTYPVAVGRRANPTPVGVFTVFQKEVNPWWYPPKGNRPVASGPNNPLGYRWLGFAPMYGIHGTNAPWQIGGVVSNGCVRMQEADVEELFPQVDYGTPVRIVYELTKVSAAADGRVTVGVYPDVYGCRSGGNSVLDVMRQLAALGVDGFVSEEQVADVLASSAGRQTVLARLHGLRVNGKDVNGQIVSVQGQLWAPAAPLAAALGKTIVFNAATGQAACEGSYAAAAKRGNELYLTLDAARRLWGGLWLWRETDNVWELAALGLGF